MTKAPKVTGDELAILQFAAVGAVISSGCRKILLFILSEDQRCKSDRHGEQRIRVNGKCNALAEPRDRPEVIRDAHIKRLCRHQT